MLKVIPKSIEHKKALCRLASPACILGETCKRIYQFKDCCYWDNIDPFKRLFIDIKYKRKEKNG